MKIGFIGTGVMGHAIIVNLMNAGHELFVYNRTKSKTDDLVANGATWKDTPKEIAAASEIIFTMVGYPQDVEQVYYDESTGIFASDVKDKILVDLTTSTPSLAEKINQTANDKGAASLDAPVSGGDLGAQNATLTIMVGGEQTVYNKVMPLFEKMGKTYTLHGTAGKGQHTKMANQIMIAGTMTGMTEMLVYADKAGLSLQKVMDTLAGGGAANWSMTNYGPRILKDDYSPGFFVKHFIKDLKIALDEAKKMSLDLPSTQLATQLYEKLADQGNENDGTQALIKLWWKERTNS
ncbi:NAD(P)-dependent oxidoreductase [Tetragenococcus koreensis]|uniref:3-hydroxyisobutyrate dehydrogenase n=1 Tax=Tetragenococcus koreensis TaxID=290335 RepID=A0AAN4RLQ3_9ENTE|nr:NAD(P)-dependent oxidoreductase [Tetragenococcus koreensis]AYW44697.1 oxidoreductase [Tetragenococcus koreensis]MCF1584185.1 NAD(P)-dependent oxidoreductase [Tetragenococcus koreensis]MCF1613682.1 NAD(P)-dependent oxidoreductase [Tetragenococcus koreensis]MCF1616277.1 NAD(P)-dependent oxidoreductase [Tetragenococcus koreensis]MCF1618995.1 NAD(P)-dependent oxidoreductase [Tetragenococcus koreensis]